MADIIGLIEQLLTEHQQILKSIDTVEQITGDLDVALELEEVKEAVMPGRLGQKSRGLSELDDVGRGSFRLSPRLYPMYVAQPELSRHSSTRLLHA